MIYRRVLGFLIVIGSLLLYMYSDDLNLIKRATRTNELNYRRDHSDFNNQPVSVLNLLDPPHLDNSAFKSIPKLFDSNPQVSLNILSQLVQQQLSNLQNSSNCYKNNILWGYSGGCGFACQIHHRAACLMISYAMGLPLIHDAEIQEIGWVFSTGWTKLMLPLGSDCSVGDHTYIWSWGYSHGSYAGPSDNIKFVWSLEATEETDKAPLPLFRGIVASTSLAEVVERLHPNPFQWWVGQFILHTLRLQPETIKRIHGDQKSIGLHSDCIGFHVRRTDKVNEYKSSFHELHEYFNKAKDVKQVSITQKQQVLLTSDDSSLLSQAKQNYPDWDVVGFESNETRRNPKERKDSLYDILRDVISLSQCHTVICGFTSNVCRLIFELQSANNLQPNVIPLDGEYSYQLNGLRLKPQMNKVDIF